jgi:hypothetical protein
MSSAQQERESNLFVPGEVKSTHNLLATTLNIHKLCLSRFYSSRSYRVCTVLAVGVALFNFACLTIITLLYPYSSIGSMYHGLV